MGETLLDGNGARAALREQRGHAMTDEHDALSEGIDGLRPWWQLIELAGRATPGKWDVRRQAEFLLKEAPWPVSGRILDAGANAGGISIELQSVADAIVAVEPNARYAKQFELVSRYVDTSKIEYRQESLFTAHMLGAFDVVLMLGLVYHFRHSQMFLDYCSNLKATRFVFSTQHETGDRPILLNRQEYHKKDHLMGWHPTQAAMVGMLNSAGFTVDKALPVMGSRPAAWAAGFTNSLYLFCTLEQPVHTDIDAIARLSATQAFWS